MIGYTHESKVPHHKKAMQKQDCLKKTRPNLNVEDIRHMSSKDNMGTFREQKKVKGGGNLKKKSIQQICNKRNCCNF